MKYIGKIWIINQFANTPDLPGHTRQFEVAKYLSKKGWNITVFASDFNLSKRKFCKLKKLQLSKIEKKSKILFHWLRVFPYYKNDWKRIANLISFGLHLFINMAGKTLQGDKPSIILASSPQLPAAFISLIFAKLLNKPFVFEVRDLWPQILIDQGGKNPKSILIRLLFFMEKFLYKYSDIVILLSKGADNYVKKRGAKKTIWLPNGPDLNQFKQTPLPEEHLGFSQRRPFLIIYAGAHGEANGLKNIIETAMYLKNEPIKFLFVGDGPEKNYLKKISKNLFNVEFKNTIENSKIPKLLSKADAIIHSLKKVKLFEYGVSPNKLYDAYAIGRPVITSTPGLINNEVEEYQIGVTSPSEDPKELSKAIKKLIRISREERIAMGNRARMLSEKIYSRERVNKCYEKIFNNFI